MTTTEDLPTRRSSSQTSDTSNKSQKTKPVRSKPSKRLSQTSTTSKTIDDPSLTSFPSLSPDNTPDPPRQAPKVDDASHPSRTVSQKARDRKATLAGLTSASPSLQGQASLFDDSPRSSLDIPGALHLASDDHIERLIARSGAVKIVRQFARDLAYRDAEISALRLRADERERELKKMLREAEVSNVDIERRLHNIENQGATSQLDHPEEAVPRPGITRKVTTSLDDMMEQAMQEDLGFAGPDHPDSPQTADLEATIRPLKDSDARSGNSSFESGKKRSGSIRGWQEYIWGSAATSRKSSRSSSIISEEDGSTQATAKPRITSASSNRRKGLNSTLFQPPTQPAGSSYFIGGAQKPLKKPPVGDEASVTSRKSAKSVASWTLKLFAGNPQAGKESNDGTGSRGRASSLGQGNAAERDSSKASGRSGLASITKVSNQPVPVNGNKATTGSSGTARAGPSTARRNIASLNAANASPDTVRSDADSKNLGPVEMETILPSDSKPPTLTDTYHNYQATDLLTDRFGFIYDQRRKKRQREALTISKHAKKPSNVESIRSFRRDSDAGEDSETLSAPKLSSATLSPIDRPATPASTEESQETGYTKRWQDYLRIATRPTELLSHTPSVGAIVSLTTAVEPAVAIQTPTTTSSRSRATSLAVEPKGALPAPSLHTEPVASPVTAEFPVLSESPLPKIAPVEQEPVKLLLEQLTDLHDSLQREKTVKWNEFLRKVRAERQKEGEATAEGRPRAKTVNMPEANLADGEVIGFSNVGNKGKVGRAKWREFKSLVLGGIPVAYRAKIWAECSGASAMRVPGYYDDLVNGSVGDSVDSSTVSQIQADIHRTLTDNVFFRNGPGTAKLNEVLVAYARRNPDVGYCQGMNLIAASLLLIMPTAEDAFWILASMIENILPSHYYDHGLLVSRADQLVLRGYVSEVLPKLSAHLDDLGVELEALTFQWFLSVFTDCLSAEALYRVWDVVLGLNTTSTTSPIGGEMVNGGGNEDDGSGSGSTFLFQLALALLKLNETQLLECGAPAEVYSYINHNMTNHAISIDGLINASEGLRREVRREDVLSRRARAIKEMEGGGRG